MVTFASQRQRNTQNKLLLLLLLLECVHKQCQLHTFSASRIGSASLSPPAPGPGCLAASTPSCRDSSRRMSAPCTALGANFLGTFFGSSHHTLPPSAAAHLLLQLGYLLWQEGGRRRGTIQCHELTGYGAIEMSSQVFEICQA